MTLQEFNTLSGLQIEDKVVYDKVQQVYMDSQSNKFDFVENLMKVFKDWIWENLDNLSSTNKERLFRHFVIYELDYYPL